MQNRVPAMETCPNDMSGIIWAIGESFFSLFIMCFF